MEVGELKFENPDQEIEHYKKLAAEYQRSLKDTQTELQEYQDGSRELEAELEAQLLQTENRMRDLKNINQLLQNENEKLQGKLLKCQTELSKTIGSLQEELMQVNLVKEDLQQYVRKLEQKNDDLERAMRASVSSLEDFEGRLNQAIERNAFLENELDEKENMTVLIQRLKDEARDLKQELTVHEMPRNSDSHKSPLEICKKTPEKVVDPKTTEIKISPRHAIRKSQTSPNGFIHQRTNMPYSALNIVGDLLKKVGVLESKLQSCRDCIKENTDHMVEKCPTSKLPSPSHMRLMNGNALSTPKDCIPLTA